MHITHPPKPPADMSAPPSPPPPDILAATWVARRYGLTPTLASVVRELAGLGLRAAL